MQARTRIGRIIFPDTSAVSRIGAVAAGALVRRGGNLIISPARWRLTGSERWRPGRWFGAVANRPDRIQSRVVGASALQGSPHLGGYPRGRGRGLGLKFCLIRLGPPLQCSGWRTRAYLSTSQNRFWQSIS